MASSICGWCLTNKHDACRPKVQRSNTIIKKNKPVTEWLDEYLICNCKVCYPPPKKKRVKKNDD